MQSSMHYPTFETKPLLRQCDLKCWTMQVLAKWTEEFGQVYKFVIGRDAVLVLTDPEEIVNLCSNSNKQDNLPKFWKAYLPIEAVSLTYKLKLLPPLQWVASVMVYPA